MGTYMHIQLLERLKEYKKNKTTKHIKDNFPLLQHALVIRIYSIYVEQALKIQLITLCDLDTYFHVVS